MREKIYFQIDAEFHRRRLDDFLFDKFYSLSKMYLREVIKEGHCEVNGYTGNSGVILKTKDFVEIEVDLNRETAMRPEKFPLDIVYEEDDFLLVNKPAEMLVHPTHRDKNGTLLNALSYYLNQEVLWRRNGEKSGADDQSEIRNPKSEIIRPGLVHRLDKKTSGLILIAKTPRAHRILSAHFERKLVEKKYLALVEGVVEEDAGEISAPIGRFEETKHWNIKTDGKAAESRFRVMERYADTTLLELQPVTGRTNQLRIHCEYIGHPIVGDERRGGREFGRLCLHAYKLAFQHPTEYRRLEFEIDLPPDFIAEEQTKKREAD
ncbi:MAG: Ribosomal large subunit pseudouridine synthase D [uncultured Pyrinomonadaceae bacterium]|uniref:Pseudouridine synthase n=1 Tax=uncultured Pyrinomonadaceae bacterium TaxID=2283094 RepID=A0A6J4PV83_9BACT|nr:MAG: Ribosomal large subunit pseudouridine synthase D [uncultured Pyrinomonadaceae bacterium]